MADGSYTREEVQTVKLRTPEEWGVIVNSLLDERDELEAALVMYANKCQRLEYELSRRK